MRTDRIFVLLLALTLSSMADARDWYSAGHGLVTTRAFVVQLSDAEAQALLPAPLTLAPEFAGKQPGRHPLVFLFSTVMPKKAHLMPILVDMPYEEFAVFMPHVRHPALDGDFLHSVILYLDSRMAVWIGQYPYRFPKIHARIDQGEGTRFGRFNVEVDKQAVVNFDYELVAGDAAAGQATDIAAQLRQLDNWFSQPLINGKRKFTCSLMDWEISTREQPVRTMGRITWQETWLADNRRLAPFTEDISGLKLETLWYLSMPFGCNRFRKPGVGK